ncbi:zinc finger CCHC domain-containing protein 7 [Patagioenas fasciata monilis]|uniref:Zinc finger CCHC domain-containing protein 7 n=1 Tax=Patagioenas fasciata monilis TaxID=372326 RepID=A0A1V4JWU9_PATFA|nr:zinc finger CCHC domain-containing protein 7 [Patagioenas fasciata monilis]
MGPLHAVVSRGPGRLTLEQSIDPHPMRFYPSKHPVRFYPSRHPGQFYPSKHPGRFYPVPELLLFFPTCRVGADLASGDVDVDWSISNKDLEAQISNRGGARHGARYYSADKAVTCRNCGRAGHLSKNCPAPKKVPPCCLCAGRGHLQSNCPARFCLNCCLPGHCYQQCLERACWSKLCNRCHMKGHYADTKPGPIKAAAAHAKRSASVYCYNCSQEGHFGYAVKAQE